MHDFSAIIAFYNEGENTLTVLQKLQRIPQIVQIIAVDDGSSDAISQQIAKKFPQVELVRLEQNKGKSYAVKTGLQKASCDHVLLIDADLQDLDVDEVKNALSEYGKRGNIDLLLLENKGGNQWIDTFINKNLFLSGQRILSKKDLQEIFRNHPPKRYQLEVAINDYMIKNKKRVFHVRTSSFNPHKMQKYGLVNGLFRDLAMEAQMISYLGFPRYAQQLLYFGKQELAN